MCFSFTDCSCRKSAFKISLGNDSMCDGVLDRLLQRSDILKEIIAMDISKGNNDIAGYMSELYNLLTYLGNAR